MSGISTKTLMAAAGAGPASLSSYWINRFQSATYRADGIVVGTEGSIFSVHDGATTSDFVLVTKHNPAGSLQWARALGNIGARAGGPFGIARDSADNIYIACTATLSGGTRSSALLLKFDSDGSLQWQKALSGANDDTAARVAVDSLGNVYLSGHTNSAGSGTRRLLAKYDSAGNLQWQRVLGGSGTNRGREVAVDSADNVYTIGESTEVAAGVFSSAIAKYNSSGAIQWQRGIFQSARNTSIYNLCIDSLDNVCVAGTADVAATDSDVAILKYNSSGTLQWSRRGDTVGFSAVSGIVADAANNLYILGEFSTSIFWMKYNSSGSFQLKRSLAESGVTLKARGIALDPDENIAALAWSRYSGYIVPLIFKVPNDGSLTGSYSPFTYGTGGPTDTSLSVTTNTTTLSEAASSLSSSTPSITSSSTTFSSTLISL